MTSRLRYASVAVIALSIGAYAYFHETSEEAIRRSFNELLSTLSIDQSRERITALDAASRANAASKYLSESCQLYLRPYIRDIHTNKRFKTYATQAFLRIQQLEIATTHIEFKELSKHTAHMQCIASVRAQTPNSINESLLAEIHWVKNEDTWLIQKAKLLRPETAQ